MKKRAILKQVVLILHLIFASPVFSLEIKALQGDLMAKTTQTNKWVRIERNSDLSVLKGDDHLMTGAQSSVTFKVENRLFKMGPNSILKVHEIERCLPLGESEYIVKACLSSLSPCEGRERKHGITSTFGGTRGQGRAEENTHLLAQKNKGKVSMEIKEYNGALDLYKNGLFANAIRRWLRFIAVYGESLLVDDAQFRIGKTLKLLKRNKEAIHAFKVLLLRFPNSLWTPQAKKEIRLLKG